MNYIPKVGDTVVLYRRRTPIASYEIERVNHKRDGSLSSVSIANYPPFSWYVDHGSTSGYDGLQAYQATPERLADLKRAQIAAKVEDEGRRLLNNVYELDVDSLTDLSRAITSAAYNLKMKKEKL